MDIHPCQKCGACCIQFEVSFRKEELEPHSFHVPPEYAVKISSEMMALRHENANKPRCRALNGKVGCNVGCQIYENRPSPCRNFEASFESGIHRPRCDAARARIGLAPLTRHDYESETIPASL